MAKENEENKLLYILKEYNRRTPNKITSLENNQVFVFGTDKYGSQRFGAAGIAARCFGAKKGISEGPTGMCYALPTKGFNIDDLSIAINRFEFYVKQNTKLTYLVTPIGCGHAGFDIAEIAQLFKPMIKLENVFLPDSFIDFYLTECKINSDDTQIKTISDNKSEIAAREIEIIKDYLKKANFTFNKEGTFTLKDKANGRIIAEAELGIESEKIVINPFNIQSKIAFTNNGYTITSPKEIIEKNNLIIK